MLFRDILWIPLGSHPYRQSAEWSLGWPIGMMESSSLLPRLLSIALPSPNLLLKLGNSNYSRRCYPLNCRWKMTIRAVRTLESCYHCCYWSVRRFLRSLLSPPQWLLDQETRHCLPWWFTSTTRGPWYMDWQSAQHWNHFSNYWGAPYWWTDFSLCDTFLRLWWCQLVMPTLRESSQLLAIGWIPCLSWLWRVWPGQS